jgi:glycosyltransferase involved in cell wall biosynthesis
VKILYLHQYFVTPAMGGGTRSYEMARRMVRAGHEVHMITACTDGSMSGREWREELIDGVNVHWLPVNYSNNMSYVERIWAFFRFAFHAGNKAISIEGDIVFATSTPLTIALPGVKTSKALGVPLVFEVRDLWPELPIAMGALRSPWSKWAARKLERWAYRNSDYIVGLSPGMCQGVVDAGFPQKKVSCIPNSCDTDIFDVPESRGEEFRNQRPWIGDRPLIVYAGTLGHINHIEYLVEIARESRERRNNLRFLVIGNGIKKAKVEALAKSYDVLDKNFFMEEAIAKSEIASLLSASTVCTSLFIPVEAMKNNSANKFFDGLAAGRPIAINYDGWQGDLLRETGAGVVLPSDSPSEGATILEKLTTDSKRINVARKAAKKLAVTGFSRDELAQKLIGVLRKAYEEKNL